MIDMVKRKSVPLVTITAQLILMLQGQFCIGDSGNRCCSALILSTLGFRTYITELVKFLLLSWMVDLYL